MENKHNEDISLNNSNSSESIALFLYSVHPGLSTHLLLSSVGFCEKQEKQTIIRKISVEVTKGLQVKRGLINGFGDSRVKVDLITRFIFLAGSKNTFSVAFTTKITFLCMMYFLGLGQECLRNYVKLFCPIRVKATLSSTNQQRVHDRSRIFPRLTISRVFHRLEMTSIQVVIKETQISRIYQRESSGNGTRITHIFLIFIFIQYVFTFIGLLTLSLKFHFPTARPVFYVQLSFWNFLLLKIYAHVLQRSVTYRCHSRKNVYVLTSFRIFVLVSSNL